MKHFFIGFVLQLQFLTRIPVPVFVKFNDRAFARGVIFAPVIGLFIGAAAVGAYLLTGLLGRPLLAVLAALVMEIAVTGGLHLDGLADTFDGLFSNRDRAGILAIMKDSRLGTSGAVGLVILILSKYIMLISVPEQHIMSCILVMPVLSRMTIAWSAGTCVHARKNVKSVSAGLIERTGIFEIVASTVVSLAVGLLFLKLLVVPLVMIVIVFTFLMNLYAKKKIGGITGDIIGAVIELAEVVFLCSVLILYRI